jgi:hypothetical protein
LRVSGREKVLAIRGNQNPWQCYPLLGYEQAADLLQETLNEEGAADKKLTKLAETVINVEAVAPVASD